MFRGKKYSKASEENPYLPGTQSKMSNPYHMMLTSVDI